MKYGYMSVALGESRRGRQKEHDRCQAVPHPVQRVVVERTRGEIEVQCLHCSTPPHGGADRWSDRLGDLLEGYKQALKQASPDFQIARGGRVEAPFKQLFQVVHRSAADCAQSYKPLE